MIVKLRKLTHKSIIGFGQFRDVTVQNLIDLKQHKELLKIYYNLGNIDFDIEVKLELCLIPERQIDKPGKDYNAGARFIGQCLYDIIERDKGYDEDNPHRWWVRNENRTKRKHEIKSNCIRQNKEQSKFLNRERNIKR